MRDDNIISIFDVLLTETTLVTKANPGPGRNWDRYRRWTGRNWDHHTALAVTTREALIEKGNFAIYNGPPF